MPCGAHPPTGSCLLRIERPTMAQEVRTTCTLALPTAAAPGRGLLNIYSALLTPWCSRCPASQWSGLRRCWTPGATCCSALRRSRRCTSTYVGCTSTLTICRARHVALRCAVLYCAGLCMASCAAAAASRFLCAGMGPNFNGATGANVTNPLQHVGSGSSIGARCSHRASPAAATHSCPADPTFPPSRPALPHFLTARR